MFRDSPVEQAYNLTKSYGVMAWKHALEEMLYWKLAQRQDETEYWFQRDRRYRLLVWRLMPKAVDLTPKSFIDPVIRIIESERLF